MKEYLEKFDQFPELKILFSKPSLKEEEIKDNHIQLFVVGGVRISDKELLYKQLFTDLSNCFWLGVKGSVHLAGKIPPSDIALTMNGVDNIMKEKGSMYICSSKSNIFQAFYEADRTHGIGENNEMFCIPVYANRIKKTIPLKRFSDSSSFPENWEDRFMSIDFSKLDYYLTHSFHENKDGSCYIESKFSIQFDPLTSFQIQLI